MKVERIEREFIFDNKGSKVVLADPNENMSAEQVLKFYTAQYPSMNNATVVKGKVDGGKQKFEIKTLVGTKG